MGALQQRTGRWLRVVFVTTPRRVTRRITRPITERYERVRHTRRWHLLRLRAAAATALLLIGAGGVWYIRLPAENAYTRGARVAERLGCFACHAHEAAASVANPGSWEGAIPPFKAGGAMASFALNQAELREWILYGSPRHLWPEGERPDAARRGKGGVVVMPAYEGLLDERELDDLVEYLVVVADLRRPRESEASRGRRVAERLGCFGCHGPEGRGSAPNPGSFKGIIPPWDSADYPEVVHDDAELEEWILDGQIRRWQSNPLARYFTDRQAIQMPGYRDVLKKGELEAIKAYIAWIRAGSPDGGSEWIAAREPLLDSQVERGAWLYRRAGCASCHGPHGEGAELGDGRSVPAVADLAEKMGLFEAQQVDAILACLEQGQRLEELGADPPVDHYQAVLDQYLSMRELILTGTEGHGSSGLPMPGWHARQGASGEPISRADIDALITYMLSLSAIE